MTDEQKECLYLATTPGEGTIPAMRPVCYCYARGVSECPTQEWKITKKCWELV